MVTRASSVYPSPIPCRPFSYRLALWCIPLFSWGLLTAIFGFTSSKAEPFTLLESDNRILLQNVQSFLQEENVPFEMEGKAIAFDSNEKERILREIRKQEWFDPKAGWNQSIAVTQSLPVDAKTATARSHRMENGL